MDLHVECLCQYLQDFQKKDRRILDLEDQVEALQGKLSAEYWFASERNKKNALLRCKFQEATKRLQDHGLMGLDSGLKMVQLPDYRSSKLVKVDVFGEITS